MPILPWTNQPLHLFHGTTLPRARNIVAGGIDIAHGRRALDFGKGFYCTTQRAQAKEWAGAVAGRVQEKEAIVQLIVPRDLLSALDHLCFIVGASTSIDYWSFVRSCRDRFYTEGHALASSRFYDVVAGPVAEDWERLTLKKNFDQMSFHTARAQTLLNNHGNRSILELW